MNNTSRLIEILQEMLRAVSQWSNNPELMVGVDGHYDEGTREAVRAFQKAYELPVTGEVDIKTWNKLENLYTLYLLENSVPNSIQPYENAKLRITHGERSDLVTIIQILLNTVRIYYDEYGILPLTGVYDDATMEAVRIFQQANLLNVTGNMDVITWNRLASAYNYAVRKHQ